MSQTETDIWREEFANRLGKLRCITGIGCNFEEKNVSLEMILRFRREEEGDEEGGGILLVSAYSYMAKWQK